MKYIRWFSELGAHDVLLIGGNNASLGEMYNELVGQGVRVPNGFAVTAEALLAVTRQVLADEARLGRPPRSRAATKELQ